MNGCFLCKDEKEVIGHILLHDAKIRILWQTVYSLCLVQSGCCLCQFERFF